MCASTLTCVFIDIDMSGCLYFTVPQYTSVLVYCTASEGYDGILRPSLLLQRSAKFRGPCSSVSNCSAKTGYAAHTQRVSWGRFNAKFTSNFEKMSVPCKFTILQACNYKLLNCAKFVRNDRSFTVINWCK
jgi:hypothetical protein